MVNYKRFRSVTLEICLFLKVDMPFNFNNMEQMQAIIKAAVKQQISGYFQVSKVLVSMLTLLCCVTWLRVL